MRSVLLLVLLLVLFTANSCYEKSHHPQTTIEKREHLAEVDTTATPAEYRRREKVV